MDAGIRILDKKTQEHRGTLTIQIQKKDKHPSRNPAVDRILSLQRTVGNRAVERLIKSGALQAKLRIGLPGDIYEQEADRVAEQVIMMPQVSKGTMVSGKAGNTIQRTCPGCTKAGNRLEKENEEESVQAKEVPCDTPGIAPDIESRINSMKGGGQSLPESVRAFYEPRFGYDFSQVRVHTDAKAVEAASAVNALAYTVGKDVVFGAGQYAPETSAGRRLLAHELAHVVQHGMAETTKLGTNQISRQQAQPPQVVQILIDRQIETNQSTISTLTVGTHNLESLELPD